MNQQKKTFLALGDSYTVGELVETSQRWTMQLIKLYEAKNILFHPPVTIAHTGATSGELLFDLQQLQPKGKFDVVSLLIGVNNQYRGYSLEEYENEFTQLVDVALDLAIEKKQVIIVSIPDWSYSPFAKNDKRGTEKISEEVASFNAINKKVAIAKGIKYADITKLSQNNEAELFAADGLHPSGLQYAKWAKEIFWCFENKLN